MVVSVLETLVCSIGRVLDMAARISVWSGQIVFSMIPQLENAVIFHNGIPVFTCPDLESRRKERHDCGLYGITCLGCKRK